MSEPSTDNHEWTAAILATYDKARAESVSDELAQERIAFRYGISPSDVAAALAQREQTERAAALVADYDDLRGRGTTDEAAQLYVAFLHSVALSTVAAALDARDREVGGC